MARTTPTYTPIGKYALAFLLSTILLISDLNYGTFSSVRGFLKAVTIHVQLVTGSFFDGLDHSISSFQANKKLVYLNLSLRDQLLQLQTKEFLENQIRSLSKDFQNSQTDLAELIGNFDIELFQIASFDLKNYLCCSSHNLYLQNPKKLEVGNNLPIASGKNFIGQTAGRDIDLIKVILLSDISHVLPIKLKDFHCNARGVGKPLLIACITDEHEKFLHIKVGDVVFTSGLGGVFPKNISLGKVASVNKISLGGYKILIMLDGNPLDKNLFGVIFSS